MKDLIICSGGLDSVSMALIKIKQGDEVELMSFNYGQKAQAELNVVKYVSEKYNLKHTIVDITFMKSIFGNNQLTDDNIDVKDNYEKSIVVPLRNSMFLQIAYIYAVTNDFDNVVLGSHLDDCVTIDNHIAFPDCQPKFFGAFEKAMWEGLLPTDKHVHVESASILGYHKKDLMRMAHEIDKDVLYRTWSCYKNEGKQCGVCDSCQNRKRAFKEAGLPDNTIYEK